MSCVVTVPGSAVIDIGRAAADTVRSPAEDRVDRRAASRRDGGDLPDLGADLVREEPIREQNQVLRPGTEPRFDATTFSFWMVCDVNMRANRT